MFCLKRQLCLPDTEFYVAGEGPCRYPHLNYLGYQPDVGALMRQPD